jgi:hypothetical protein
VDEVTPAGYLRLLITLPESLSKDDMPMELIFVVSFAAAKKSCKKNKMKMYTMENNFSRVLKLESDTCYVVLPILNEYNGVLGTLVCLLVEAPDRDVCISGVQFSSNKE